jgi:hypothetical protein
MEILMRAAKLGVGAVMMTTDSTDQENIVREAREILHLPKDFTGRTSGLQCKAKKTFSIDLGIIVAINIVYNMYSDRAIRREALNILRSSPRREGVWDSVLTAGIDTWLMDLEEEPLWDGYTVEDVVVKMEKIDVDVKARTATLECSRKVGRMEKSHPRRSRYSWDDV